MSSTFAGFGIDGFKSFGSGEMQFIGPMENVHLIVGKNNVGKSNALSFVSTFMTKLRDVGPGVGVENYLTPLDVPSGRPAGSITRFAIGLRLTHELSQRMRLYGDAAAFDAVLHSKAFSLGHPEVAWFKFALAPATDQSTSYIFEADLDQLKLGLEQSGTGEGEVANLSSKLTNQSSDLRNNYQTVMSFWEPWSYIPGVENLDAVREITDGEGYTTPDDMLGLRNGRGLINRLFAIQHPDEDTYDADTARFQALQAFVRDVLDDQTARVEVPASKKTIYVHTSGGAVRSVKQLGTGISEIVILAAMATGVEGKLICIEEPEAHLHPTAQRKLIEYLSSNQNNRYLIATHSAQILNADLSSITHTTMTDGFTRTQEVANPGHLSSAVFDLGNRASDLVQSNFIVWVEGPTDRMYVGHWLAKLDPELIEGAHFSIMFYGGGLLNHLSADDQETVEFIDLLRINRNLAIVIDSDKKEEKASLNSTKMRVIHEISSLGAVAWVTEGYTIENYFGALEIQGAVDAEYPSRSYSVPLGQFESPLGNTFDGSASKPSKVMVARRLIADDRSVAVWPRHLRENIQRLSAAIRHANDLRPLLAELRDE